MKRCPECRKDYLDDSLLYCLDDGTPLVQGSVSDEPATAILSGDAISAENPTRTLKGDDTAARESKVVSRLLALFARERLPWVIAGVMTIIAVAVTLAFYSRDSNTTGAVRLSFEPPKNLSFNDTQADWAVISPDGEKIAFTANTPDGKYLLYVSDLKTGQVTPLPGSDNALEPFWSPDSKSIAYGSRGKLRRSDIAGGNAQVLTDAPRLVAGTWNNNGDIIFCPDYGSVMFTVSAKGGEPRQITFHEDQSELLQHSSGTFLPDGKQFLFNRGSTKEELVGLWLGSLDSKEIKRIIPGAATVRFAPPDWLVMVRNQVLVAQKINTNSGELIGDPVPLITQTDNAASAPARFSVSTGDVLVWQPQWSRSYHLRFFDREGKQTGAIGNPEMITGGATPRISPDGKQVAYRNADGSILVSDLEGNSPIKLANLNQLPVWSRDGKSIAANAVASVGRGILQRASNGVGEPELLLAGTVFPRQYSPDGQFLMYTKRGPKTRLDVWLLSLGDKREIPLLASAADEAYAEISPNGKWLAYTSDETGEQELYVQSFNPDGTLGNDRKRISTDGALRLAWNRDGRELFFVNRANRMMATSVNTNSPGFDYTPPKVLFETKMLFQYGGADFFDVTPDGKFLIGTLVGEPTAPAPTVILNWQELLKK